MSSINTQRYPFVCLSVDSELSLHTSEPKLSNGCWNSVFSLFYYCISFLFFSFLIQYLTQFLLWFHILHWYLAWYFGRKYTFLYTNFCLHFSQWFSVNNFSPHNVFIGPYWSGSYAHHIILTAPEELVLQMAHHKQEEVFWEKP